MQVSKNKRNQAFAVSLMSALALTLVAGGEPPELVLEFATVSGGGGLVDGGLVMTGQPLSGTASNGVIIIEVGFVFSVEESAGCAGDIDGDGIVGPADLAQLLGSWGPNPDHPADFNGDDVVDAADLAQLLGGWGSCP